MEPTADSSDRPRPEARPRWSAGLAVALPGLLLGIHLGGLLFFLNPHLPFELIPVGRTCLVYGAVGATLTGLLGLPLARHAPRRTLRFLPWGLTASLALVAILDSTHASHFAYYLPSGINDRLIKASLWLTLATLIAFYTALLHTLHRRPYGIRSRLAYAALMLASIYVMVERREAFEPFPTTERPALVESSQIPRLLVVGVESASPEALLPLAEEGRTPFLDRMLDGGAYGHLDSLSPNRPAALWTTLATGKYPHRHGVVGGDAYPAPWIAPGAELRLLPAGLGFSVWGTFGARPSAQLPGSHRRVRALWEILPLLGVPSGVVGWPASAPLEPGPTFAVTDRFFAGRFAPEEAHPAGLSERARIFRVTVDELDLRLTGQFGDDPPDIALEALADDHWRESLTAYLTRPTGTAPPGNPASAPPEAIFVQLPGLARVSERAFGAYADLRIEGHQAAELERPAALLADYYAAVDLMISELWETIPEPKLLAVVSAFGVEPESDGERAWARLMGRDSLGGDWKDSPSGLILLHGAGIKPGQLLTRAHLTDLAPTLLYGMGLPVARDLDGRILTEAFLPELLETTPLTFLPSYEQLEAVGATTATTPDPGSGGGGGSAPPS